MMTLPLTGPNNSRCRRFRTNMAIDSFSAAAVSLVLNIRTKQRGEEELRKMQIQMKGRRQKYTEFTLGQ